MKKGVCGRHEPQRTDKLSGVGNAPFHALRSRSEGKRASAVQGNCRFTAGRPRQRVSGEVARGTAIQAVERRPLHSAGTLITTATRPRGMCPIVTIVNGTLSGETPHTTSKSATVV